MFEHVAVDATMGTAIVLVLGFASGLVHALDADHVAAVSGFVAAGRSGLLPATRWSLGHGLALVVVGLAVYAFGLAIPEGLATVAEWMVGLALVLIGLLVLIRLRQPGNHLHFHSHDDLGRHSHWHHHEASSVQSPSHDHRHAATLVGAVHGLAGSAPLLALVPLAAVGSVWLALGYLVVFSIGVLVSMLVVAGVLGLALRKLATTGRRAARVARGTVGVFTIGLGVFWLLPI